MFNKLASVLVIYLAFCSFIAFIDIDFDSESEQSARSSMSKQMLYMNGPQKGAYLNDLETIDSAGMMGGMRAQGLHGMEAHDIHDLANEIRVKRGQKAKELPSRSMFELISKFFAVPNSIIFH